MVYRFTEAAKNQKSSPLTGKTTSPPAAEQEKEVERVLADTSHHGPEQVQDVLQLHDGASNSVGTKTDTPRAENSNKGSTTIDNQCIKVVLKLQKRYPDIFVIGENELKPVKNSKFIYVDVKSSVKCVKFNSKINDH